MADGQMHDLAAQWTTTLNYCGKLPDCLIDSRGAFRWLFGWIINLPIINFYFLFLQENVSRGTKTVDTHEVCPHFAILREKNV
jgi:hypothetical protein